MRRHSLIHKGIYTGNHEYIVKPLTEKAGKCGGSGQ